MRLISACRFTIVTICLTMAMSLFGHHDKSAHATDFRSVFNGYNDMGLYAFYLRFSSGIDSGLLTDIEKALGDSFGCSKLHVSFGDHRYYAHSWPFGADIPRYKLDKLEKIHPGAWDVIKPVWRKFCGEQISYAMFELKFPRDQARAFCAILYYIHLLGDWDPKDNSMFHYVMTCDEIVENMNKQFAVLFVNHPEMAAEIRQRLEQAKVVSTDDCQKSLAIMKALRDSKIGTKIHQTWGRYFEKAHPWSGENPSGEGAVAPAKAA